MTNFVELDQIVESKLDLGLLGRGYSSFSESLRQPALVIKPQNITYQKIGSDFTQFNLISSKNSLYSSLSLSASVRFDGIGSSASASADFSKKVQFDERNIYLLARRSLKTIDIYSSFETLTDAAIVSLNIGGDEFLKGFGDRFVNNVRFGGEIFLLAEITAKSSSEKEALSVHVDGSYGAWSGAADMASELRKLSSVANVSLTGYAYGIGTKEELNLMDKALDVATNSAEIRDLVSVADNLKKYLDNDGFGTAIGFSYTPYSGVGGASTPMPDYSSKRQAIQASARADEVIDRFNAKLSYLRSADERLGVLDQLAMQDKLDQLEVERAKIADYVFGLVQSTGGETPALPEINLPDSPSPAPVRVKTLKGSELDRTTMFSFNQSDFIEATKGKQIEVRVKGLAERTGPNFLYRPVISFRKSSSGEVITPIDVTHTALSPELVLMINLVEVIDMPDEGAALFVEIGLQFAKVSGVTVDVWMSPG